MVMSLLEKWQALRTEVMSRLATVTGIDTVLELESQEHTAKKNAVGFIRIAPEPIETPTLGGAIRPVIRFQVGGYIKSTDESKTAEIKGELWLAMFDWISGLATLNDDFNGLCYILEFPKNPVVTDKEVSVSFKVQLPE